MATNRPFSHQHEIWNRLSCCIYTFKEFQCRIKSRVVTIRWNDYFRLCGRFAYAGSFFGFYRRPVFCRDFFALYAMVQDTMRRIQWWTKRIVRIIVGRTSSWMTSPTKGRTNACLRYSNERKLYVTLTQKVHRLIVSKIFTYIAFINILYTYLHLHSNKIKIEAHHQ